MNNSIWIWILAAIIVIGGGIWWYESSQAPAMNAAQTSSTDMTGMTSTSSDTGVSVGVTTGTIPPMTATVTYSGTSFTPATVTIAQGGTVTFVDASGRGFWIASNPHPVHTGYDGTTRAVHCAAGYTGAAPFDQCVAGTSYSFTFNKTGTWPYHNHLGAQVGGTVVVQ